MPKFAHRVAFNADLFMTITTDSADATIEQLEAEVINKLTDACASDGLPVGDSEELGDLRAYPRWSGYDGEHLDNISIENVEEVEEEVKHA